MFVSVRKRGKKNMTKYIKKKSCEKSLENLIKHYFHADFRNISRE